MPLLGHFTKTVTKPKTITTQKEVHAGYDWRNNSVLRWRRKTSSEGDSLTDDGRAFQARASATEKGRSPWVLQWVAGTNKSIASVERRRRRPSIRDDSCRDSAIYAAAVPWRLRYANTHRRNLILSGAFNQWRSFRNGVIWSHFRATKMRRAAALRTDWSRLIRDYELDTFCNYGRI